MLNLMVPDGVDGLSAVLENVMTGMPIEGNKKSLI